MPRHEEGRAGAGRTWLSSSLGRHPSQRLVDRPRPSLATTSCRRWWAAAATPSCWPAAAASTRCARPSRSCRRRAWEVRALQARQLDAGSDVSDERCAHPACCPLTMRLPGLGRRRRHRSGGLARRAARGSRMQGRRAASVCLPQRRPGGRIQGALNPLLVLPPVDACACVREAAALLWSQHCLCCRTLALLYAAACAAPRAAPCLALSRLALLPRTLIALRTVRRFQAFYATSTAQSFRHSLVEPKPLHDLQPLVPPWAARPWQLASRALSRSLLRSHAAPCQCFPAFPAAELLRRPALLRLEPGWALRGGGGGGRLAGAVRACGCACQRRWAASPPSTLPHPLPPVPPAGGPGGLKPSDVQRPS